MLKRTKQEGKFVISVKNNKRIDFEQTKQMNFKVRDVARTKNMREFDDLSFQYTVKPGVDPNKPFFYINEEFFRFLLISLVILLLMPFFHM